MKFAHEVMELLEPYPGREWRMVQIVRYVAQGKHLALKDRRAMRKGIQRVLSALIESGTVTVRPERRGGPAWYAWRRLEPAKSET